MTSTAPAAAAAPTPRRWPPRAARGTRGGARRPRAPSPAAPSRSSERGRGGPASVHALEPRGRPQASRAGARRPLGALTRSPPSGAGGSLPPPRRVRQVAAAHALKAKVGRGSAVGPRPCRGGAEGGGGRALPRQQRAAHPLRAPQRGPLASVRAGARGESLIWGECSHQSVLQNQALKNQRGRPISRSPHYGRLASRPHSCSAGSRPSPPARLLASAAGAGPGGGCNTRIAKEKGSRTAAAQGSAALLPAALCAVSR